MIENHYVDGKTSFAPGKSNAAVAHTLDLMLTAVDQGQHGMPGVVASTRNHYLAARTLKNALTLGHFEAWNAFSAIAAARLDEREKAALAFAALRAQTPDHARMVVEAALDDGAGPPLPPFMHITSEATFWASMASTQERKVCVLAAFNALRPEEQRDFLKFVTKEVA